MTSDEMARAIRIAERAYKRVFSQRNNSWEWASAITEAAVRLGQLRLESWQFTGGTSESNEQDTQVRYATERDSHNGLAIRVHPSPRKPTAARVVLPPDASGNRRVRS